MKRKTLILTVTALLLTGLASASVNVNPNYWSQTGLTSGEDFTQEVQITNNNNEDYLVSVETDITGENTNNRGINVSHSPKYFVLNSGEAQTIDIQVTTSTALKPDTFTFKTYINKIQEEKDTGGGGDDYEDEYEETQEELNQTREQLEDKNQTEEQLRNRIDRLVDDLEDWENNQTDENESQEIMDQLEDYEERINALQENNTELQEDLNQTKIELEQETSPDPETGNIQKSIKKSFNPRTPLTPPTLIISTVLQFFGWL